MQIIHPYDDLCGGSWLTGNLHAHTTISDGKMAPQAVIDEYARRGHHFLMFSDHDRQADASVYATLDARGMILVPGNEISGQGPHMLHVNGARKIEPHADRQRVIDETKVAGGFIVLCHPNWLEKFDYISIDALRQFSGYTGIEIYNGVIGRLAGSPYALDKWDLLLSAGRQVWGYANDDSHGLPQDYGLGWNCVYAQHRTPDAIAAALQAGRFYASTGVQLEQIEVHGNRIRIVTINAERIVAMKQHARRIEHTDSREIEIEVPDDAHYVRFECWGRGESFAWTQPFFITR